MKKKLSRGSRIIQPRGRRRVAPMIAVVATLLTHPAASPSDRVQMVALALMAIVVVTLGVLR